MSNYPMSNYEIHYTTPPALSLNAPDCGSCLVEVDADTDGLTCPRCGTYWDHDQSDGDEGSLYTDQTGEAPEGEERAHDNGCLPTASEDARARVRAQSRALDRERMRTR